MNTDEYQAAVRLCAMCAGILSQFDLPDILDRIDHADAIGPLFNPTLWLEKHTAMSEDREAVEAALPLWRFGQKLKNMRAAAGSGEAAE